MKYSSLKGSYLHLSINTQSLYDIQGLRSAPNHQSAVTWTLAQPEAGCSGHSDQQKRHTKFQRKSPKYSPLLRDKPPSQAWFREDPSPATSRGPRALLVGKTLPALTLTSTPAQRQPCVSLPPCTLSLQSTTGMWVA